MCAVRRWLLNLISLCKSIGLGPGIEAEMLMHQHETNGKLQPKLQLKYCSTMRLMLNTPIDMFGKLQKLRNEHTQNERGESAGENLEISLMTL